MNSIEQQQQRKKMTPTKTSFIRSMPTLNGFLLFQITFIILITTNKALGALFSNAQYNQANICDSSKLIRCQQDVLRDMQTANLNSASIQYPINSGPPYSPSVTNSKQLILVNQSTCRLVRSNLDCLLTTTPACYDQGIQTAQNTDIILRAKRFLEQNNCNEPDTTWQSTFCYRQNEIRSCEERYGFTTNNLNLISNNLIISNNNNNNNNITACLAYQAFKYCVESHLRLNCKVHEMDMANEYLIDRASDLVWRCPILNTTTISSNNLINNPYQLNNHAILSPNSISSYSGNNFANYEQRPIIPSYVGSSSGNLNLFPGSSSIIRSNSFNNDQAWERFRNPLDETTRFGVSRYPGSGEVFDRIVAGNSFDAETSDCPIKAAPYARECEDNLLEQQRLAKDSRDGAELQRRICCSLFQYRDCISRVVLDRCADSSPTAVEILMGIRRREMTITCRSFNRDVCSGSLKNVVLNSSMLFAIVILTSFFTFKQSFIF